jgi:hypothetical protein
MSLMSWFTKIFVDKEEPLYEEVRARNEKGQYIADDPNTPENEAFKRVIIKEGDDG